ncbi:hypothetical protein O181_083246 [Austropuccinia psidii MF-1]|uniref:Uncharacterized protein n=1 Tax=Austropuccinia psidii MF-1 TaxID=1389203 RepID=A0A9Q3FU76_9BASI|nr:hypothetical protein [Austropuccinia psidii MF-1]
MWPDESIDQGELNQLRILEPQRTDGVSTEGEDSVSSVPNVGFHGPLGPKSSVQDLPFNSGGGHLLDGPGPLSIGPGNVGGNRPKATIFGPLDPLEPQKIWAQEDSNSPHGPQTADCIL